MSQCPDNEIAKCWIKLTLSKEHSEDHRDNFWSFDILNDLCDNDPNRCYKIISIIRSLDGSDIVLANLAAGPLEDLLSKHGEEFIDRIEKDVFSDAQFKKLLGAVWQNSISDSVWERIKKIASPTW